MRVFVKYLVFLFISIFVIACVGNSDQDNISNNNLPIVSNLANSGGAVLTIPTSKISLAVGNNTTSTAITLQGGYSNLAIALSANASAPIQVSFSPESLVAGTPNINSSISISATDELTTGVYPINLYADYIPQGDTVTSHVLIGTIQLTVSNTVPNNAPGVLSITPSPIIQKIGIGYSRYITVSLVGSQNTSDIAVALSSSNTSVASVNQVNQQTCLLSTQSPNNICTIEVNGVSIGNATITASAQNYASVSSAVKVVQYAYITSEADNNYTQCDVGLAGIESATCVHKSPTGNGALTNPFGVAFNGNYAYFVNNIGSYTQCSISADGIEPASCITNVLTNILVSPNQIAFSGDFAFFANYNSTYTQCSVNESGIESSTCSNNSLGVMLKNPLSVSVNESYAYFSNSYATTTKCSIGQSGIESSSCVSLGVYSTDLAFNNGYVLTANNYSTIQQCLVMPDGSFSSCGTFTLPLEINPYALAYNGSYVYYVDHGLNLTYLQCGLSGNGSINTNSCQAVVLPNDTINTAIAFH